MTIALFFVDTFRYKVKIFVNKRRFMTWVKRNVFLFRSERVLALVPDLFSHDSVAFFLSFSFLFDKKLFNISSFLTSRLFQFPYKKIKCLYNSSNAT